jgi:hypothetical protein
MSATLVSINILADMRPRAKTRLHLASAQLVGYGDVLVLFFTRHHPRAAGVGATAEFSPSILTAPVASSSAWVRAVLHVVLRLLFFPRRQILHRDNMCTSCCR